MKRVLVLLTAIWCGMSLIAFGKEGKSNVTDSLIDTLYQKAILATRSGLYNDALRLWLDYLDLSSQNPDNTNVEDLLTAYLAVGSVHFTFDDYESAVTFFKKALELAQRNGKTSSVIRVLNNLVGAYTELGEISRGDSCNQEMHRVAKAAGIKDYEHNYLFNKGYIARKKGNYNAAISYMRLALAVAKKYSADFSPVYLYSEMYPNFESIGRLDSALHYLRLFEESADKPYLQLDCYKGYMRIYTKLGMTEEALKYQSLYFRVSDSVLNSRDFMQTRNSWLFNERKEKEEHIALLEENLYLSRLGILFITITLVLILAFAVALILQKRKLNELNSDLYARNKDLIDLHDRLTEEWRSHKITLPTSEENPDSPTDVEDTTKTSVENKEEDQTRKSELLARIIEYMETTDAYLSPNFSLAQLAKDVDSNTKYVSQVINERTGNSFRVFINNYRIMSARKRIIDQDKWGHLTIQSIGESVGFKSSANFIAAFKKVTGMTPSVYMNISRQDNQKPQEEQSDPIS